MSISNIGATSTDALQKHLKADLTALSSDEAKKASQATLQADQAKITADQQAIKSAQDKAKAAKQTSHGNGGAAKDAPSTTSAVVSTSTSAKGTGGVDVSV
jgi:peptidoglycan hydrolase CwlO-like protein